MDAVMKHLQSKPQVFEQVIAVGGGPPFYHATLQSDRVSMARSNGRAPDNWSQGNRWLIVRKSITGTFQWLVDRTPWANEERKQEKQDRHAYYIQAPGHEYNWAYPEWRSQIIEFLRYHFC